MPPMSVAKTHDAYDQGETPSWAWPVYAFVAWLAMLLNYIARFRRARRFRHDWRESWEGLRQSEWLRDQLIAQGVAQLINGDPLQLDDTKVILDPPTAYGGPCPRTPFEMNRRFLALARWAADPEAIIRERFERLARRQGVNPLEARASTDAALRAAAQHEVVGVSRSLGALMLSSAQSARPSKHERGLTTARGPPGISYCLLPTAYCLESASFRERLRTPAPTRPPSPAHRTPAP